MMVVILIAVVVLLCAAAQYKKAKALEERRAKMLARAQPYVKDQLFISVDGSSLIGFDFQAKAIYLACAEFSGKYQFEQIASCELIRDEVSLTQTNRGSQVLGAVVGDVLLGPVGGLVGSLSGSKRNRNRLARLELKIVVDCHEHPVHRVVLFASRSKNGVASNDPRLRPHLAVADRFHGHVVNAIRNSALAEQASRKSADYQPLVTDGSPNLRHLRELFELKQIGAISEQEYESAKMKALGSS